jgi:surfeit locus 1 family protein
VPVSSPALPSRSLVAPAIATVVALAILVSLGMWQLERKAWKESLIAQIEARAHGAPGEIVPEAAWTSWRASEDEFRRVRLTGTYLHDLEAPVHGLAAGSGGRAAQGYFVFTPLKRPDGSVVIINRGFVPTELRDPASRAAGQVAGEVAVTGLVRAPESARLFVPDNHASRNEWFTRDIGAIARAKGLDRVAPFTIDADATANPGGWPKGGQTRLSIRNDHLTYALTWFGLGLTLLGVFGAWAWRRLRGEPEPLVPPRAAP